MFWGILKFDFCRFESAPVCILKIFIIMEDLTLIQKEIVFELEYLKEKLLITEKFLAKKVREHAKIQGKSKAGICLNDLEICLRYLSEQKQLNFSIHLNSANDIFIKKDDFCKFLENDAKKRRLSSEKSMSVLTSGDLREKSSGGKIQKKRIERKKLNCRMYEEFLS